MTTSALSLYQLLSPLKEKNEPKRRVTSLLVEELGLDERDGEAEVVRIFSTLVSTIEEDLLSLDLAPEQATRASHHLAPFLGLKNLSLVYHTHQNAATNFLKPENLNGLMDLHLALMGRVEYKPLDKETVGLATKFRDLVAEVHDTDLPDAVKRSVVRRLDQIAVVLEHFYAFGAEDLQAELEGIIGSLVVNKPEKGSAWAKTYNAIAIAVSTTLLGLAQLDDASDNVISLAQKGQLFLQELKEGDD